MRVKNTGTGTSDRPDDGLFQEAAGQLQVQI